MDHCGGGATVRIALPLAVAFVLWGSMFGLHWGSFWLMMSLSAGLLALYGFVQDRDQLVALLRWRWVWLPAGFILAAVLYALFWAANWFAGFVFPFAPTQVAQVYDVRGGTNPWLIGVALVFWIGPAEELFWRGFLQNALERCWSSRWWAVLAAAGVYAGVHVWSGNMMLVGAAFTAGLFWGGILVTTSSLWPGIISHAIWDVAIFLLWPIGV